MVLSGKSQPWSGEVAPSADSEAIVEQERLPMENRCEENGDVIARDVRSAVKKLVENERG